MYYYYYYPPYGQLPDFSGFRQRLDYLLAGRKLYPWAASIGVSKGAAEKMQQNIVPGSDILRVIHFHEGVELSWLVTGKGKPFKIYNSLDTEDFANTINSRLRFDLEKKVVHFCHDGERVVIAIGSDLEYVYKKQSLSSYYWELYSGYFSRKLGEMLVYYFSSEGRELTNAIWNHSAVSAEELLAIMNGERGSKYLFGDKDKLEPVIKSLPIDDMALIVEPLFKRIAEQQLAQQGNVISTDLLSQVMTVIDGFCNMQPINLDVGQKAKLYTSFYDHCQRTSCTPGQVPSDYIQTLIRMV